MISVVIPVISEALMINRLIHHLRGLELSSELEVVVVDGDPGGSTLREIRDPHVVRLIGKRGRGSQMNRGALAASGDTLLFLHADTRLPPDAGERIENCLASGAHAGAFRLGIDSEEKIFRIIEKGAWFRTFLTGIPYGDQAIFIKRDLFLKMGGYRNIPIMEDVEFMGRIKKNGKKVVVLPRKAMTSSRRWDREGVLYCTCRNWMLSLLFKAGVSPEKLVRFYKN